MKSLIDAISFPIISTDGDLKIKYSNEAAQQAFLISKKKLGSIIEIFPEHASQLEELKTEIKESSTKCTLIHKSSDQQQAIFSATTKWDQESDAAFFCFSPLRSDAESNEEILSALKSAYDQKFALNQSSIVATTDANGLITYANDKFVEISKYSREELIGNDHRMLNSDYHPKEFFGDLWTTIKSGEVWQGDICNRSKDGKRYWVDTTIVPFLNEKKKPYQYMAIRTEITDKKYALEQLENERVRLLHAEKMASLGQLAAGVAHELGNPISSITAWLEIVSGAVERGETEDLDLEKMLPMVKSRAERMKTIIRGMLNYARDGSKDPFERVSIPQLLGDVLEYCSYKLRKAEVTVTKDFERESFYTDGRLSELSQVFVNLVINSIDAIANLEDRWININIGTVGEKIHINFVDSGNGISAELAENIMKPFYTTKSSQKGTGLGLSISNSIVSEHHGRLFLDAKCKNTKFVVELPLS